MVTVYGMADSGNCYKVKLALETLALPYRWVEVDSTRGGTRTAEFLARNPNGKVPTLQLEDGSHLPESGAILFYLARRTGRFMPKDERRQVEVLQWLFWQVGNQGPMAGQLSHFVNYAPGENAYARARYANEYDRCLGVLERRLEGRAFILDDYSIADMISWPWVLIAKPLGQSLEPFSNVRRWRQTIKERPAVRAGVDLCRELRRSAPPSEEERRNLFNQTSRTATDAAG